jgi:hypothetical protein
MSAFQCNPFGVTWYDLFQCYQRAARLAIQMGRRVTKRLWSSDLAIREANCLSGAIHYHGECPEVIVDGADSNEPSKRIKNVSSSWLQAFSGEP